MRRYDRAYRAVKAAMDDGEHRRAAARAHGPPQRLGARHVHQRHVDDRLGDPRDRHHPLAVRPGDRGDDRGGEQAQPAGRGGACATRSSCCSSSPTAPSINVEVFVNCRYGYDVRCEVVGSEGTVSMDNPSTNALLRAGRRAESVPADWRVRFDLAYLEEMQEWVDGLAAGRRQRSQLLGRLRGGGRGQPRRARPGGGNAHPGRAGGPPRPVLLTAAASLPSPEERRP